MAKKPIKNKATKSSATFSFTELAKKLNKVNPESELLTKETKSIKIENWYSTGNYMLNALISGSIYKGIPEGRITILAGAEASGKTFLALNVAREALNQGAKLIWIDTENAMDDLTFERFGIDIDKGNVIRVPIDTVENVATYLVNFATELKNAQDEGINIGKYMVVIDSLGQLSTVKEMEDTASGSEKADMTRAKGIKRLFRVCTKKLGQLKIPVIITNHVYSSLSLYSQPELGGGTGPKFSSSTTVYLTKAQLKEDGKKRTGALITANINKSRFTIQGIPVKFHISFYKGMNKFVGLEEYISWDDCGIDYGKIEKGEYIPQSQARNLAVKHLGKHISPKKLWTPAVFTKEVLDILDKKIKNIFELPPTTKFDEDLYDLVYDEEEDEEKEYDAETGEIFNVNAEDLK